MKLKSKLKELTPLFGGIAGGLASNFVSNQLDKQSFMAKYTQYTPAVTCVLSAIGYLYGPKMLKSAFYGSAIVSGAEFAGSYLPGAMGAVLKEPSSGSYAPSGTIL